MSKKDSDFRAGVRKALDLPVRVEELKIRMKLDMAAKERYPDACEALNSNIDYMDKGDWLDIRYTLFCRYFGDIVEKLTAVQELCEDPAIVIDASCEELEAGRVLIFEVCKRLENVIALSKARETAAGADRLEQWKRDNDPKNK
jgi:hypothetical protein